MVASASIGVVGKPCVFQGRHTNFCWSNKNSHIFQTFRGKNSSFGKKLRSNPNFHHTSPINFPLFSPKTPHFPNFSWHKLFKNPQKHMSFRFSHVFPMIFPWFFMIFPCFSWWKPTIPRCHPADPPRTSAPAAPAAPAPWIWQRRRAAAGASGWWRCCWRPWRIRMLEPLETWFGYISYIVIYKYIYIYLYMALYIYILYIYILYIYMIIHIYIYIHINVNNIAARTGVRPGEVRFDCGSVFFCILGCRRTRFVSNMKRCDFHKWRYPIAGWLKNHGTS